MARKKYKTTKPRIDTAWFRGIMADRGIEGQSVALQMHLDPSAFSRRLRGKLAFRPEETVRFARILGIPHEDILAHLGIEARDVVGSEKVPVVGWVDSEMIVHHGAGLRGARAVIAPPGVGKNAEALRFQTAGGTREAFNGAVVYYTRGTDTPRDTAIGKWCVLGIGGKTMIGAPRAGYSRGFYAVGELTDVRLDFAWPILWAQF